MFSGGGGLDLGAALAGFKVMYASDLETEHCETIGANFPDCVAVPKDIVDLKGREIRKTTSTSHFDLLAGGPPCQAFSILGNRDSFNDPRGRLVYEYARLVKELKPEAFIFENVPGLLSLNRGRDWEELLNYFRVKTKYKLFTHKLNAADFGIPQIRIRVFIVGFRNRNASFAFPSPTHMNQIVNQQISIDEEVRGLKPWVPAKYALEDVAGLPNHRIRPHGPRVSRRYLLIPQGGRDRIDHTDRIDPERPSGTVLVGSRAGGGRPHIHPFEHRHISVREAARLQSFPDWYVFQNSETWQYRAVGNAVPPLLASAVCQEIACSLDQLAEAK